MKYRELVSICAISAFGGSSLFIGGMRLLPAIGIGLVLLIVGLSMVNYLANGKFHPFVKLSK